MPALHFQPEVLPLVRDHFLLISEGLPLLPVFNALLPEASISCLMCALSLGKASPLPQPCPAMSATSSVNVTLSKARLDLSTRAAPLRDTTSFSKEVTSLFNLIFPDHGKRIITCYRKPISMIGCASLFSASHRVAWCLVHSRQHLYTYFLQPRRPFAGTYTVLPVSEHGEGSFKWAQKLYIKQ